MKNCPDIRADMKNALITKQGLCYSMNSLFLPHKKQISLRQNKFILKVFILINNQLLSAANAKDTNTDYYFTNSTLALNYHGSVA